MSVSINPSNNCRGAIVEHKPGISSLIRRSSPSRKIICSAREGVIGDGPGYPLGKRSCLLRIISEEIRAGFKSCVHSVCTSTLRYGDEFLSAEFATGRQRRIGNKLIEKWRSKPGSQVEH